MFLLTLRDRVQICKRSYITRVLDHVAWSYDAASRTLGISQATLYRQLAALEIFRPKPLGPGFVEKLQPQVPEEYEEQLAVPDGRPKARQWPPPNYYLPTRNTIYIGQVLYSRPDLTPYIIINIDYHREICSLRLGFNATKGRRSTSPISSVLERFAAAYPSEYGWGGGI